MTKPTRPASSTDAAAHLATELYQLLVTNLPASAVMMFDHDLRFVLADGPELGRHGHSKASLEGRRLYDAVDPAFAALVEPNLRAALEGKRFRAELPFGDLMYAYTYEPLLNADGSVKYALVMAQDVTALRQAEQRALRNEARIREVIGSVPAVVFAIGADRRVRYSDGLALSRLGLRPGEIVGQSVDDVYRGHTQLLHHIDLALSGQRLVADVPVGDAIWETRYSPVLSPDGSVTEAVGVALDVTEHRRTEASNRQSQKLEAIGRLAGGVAHDFNNMLGVIMNAGEELQLALSVAPEWRELADMIVSASDRAAQLTRQLLAFSRGGHPDPKPVVIDSVVEEAVTLLSRAIDGRVRLRTEFRSGRAVAVVDAAQLENAVLNLGLNARDAMPAGGDMTIATDVIAVDAQAATELGSDVETGTFVRITVSDTGVGIQPEHLARVFDPFFTTKGVGAGTGLGLSVVYGTARAHGGAVTVKSAPGCGATFQILLPISTRHEAPAISPPGAATTDRGLILLVEDELLVRQAAERLLRSLGYDVVTAAGGQEGLERFSDIHDRLAMVLCDVAMPGLPGPEAVRRMRAVDPTVPVAMCSGYTSEHLDLLDGAEKFEVLAKPYGRSACAALLARTARRAQL